MESFPLKKRTVRANGSPRTMRRFSPPDSPSRAGAAAASHTCTAATHRCALPGMRAPCATTRPGSIAAASRSTTSWRPCESRSCGKRHKRTRRNPDCRFLNTTTNTIPSNIRSRIRSRPAVRIAMAMPGSAVLVPEPAEPSGRAPEASDETGKQVNWRQQDSGNSTVAEVQMETTARAVVSVPAASMRLASFRGTYYREEWNSLENRTACGGIACRRPGRSKLLPLSSLAARATVPL